MFLKETFNTVACQYDHIRPKYPTAIFDKIISLFSEFPIKALEVGCGTGQATECIVYHEVELTCVDIGTDLLDIAKNKFSHCSNVSFKHSSFEELEFLPNSLDLIFAATSFHWVDPKIKYRKSASLLKPKRYLAIISQLPTHTDCGFFAESQKIYNSIAPELSKKLYETLLSQKEDISPLIEVETIEHIWSEKYSANEYIELLSTYSDHINLSNLKRRQLFDALHEMIDKEYSGFVIKDYSTKLQLYQSQN
jgi:ubiquinone/menaquinone biosynthesis C-methylase UbiE